MDEHRGGLTFVFTDIEGSTQLVRDLAASYGLALRIHHRVLQSCFEEHAGREMGSAGDGFFFVFPTPAKAVAAAVVAQQKLEHYDWPEGVRLRVRMGIHCGPVTISGGEYVGLTVHEVSRISAVAHGGQILCSSSVADGLDTAPPDGELRELGVYRLRGFPEPRRLFQVCAPGLEDDFPPPRDAVRDGGVRVSIWRRLALAADGDGGPARPAPRVSVRPIEGEHAGDVTVELGRALNGPADAFRLIVRRSGIVEEEYDGLTVGGPTDAAGIVNTHSTLVRIDP